MGDKRALQAGTSHNLGQNFAKAFDTQFLDENGRTQYVHQSSWGVQHAADRRDHHDPRRRRRLTARSIHWSPYDRVRVVNAVS